MRMVFGFCVGPKEVRTTFLIRSFSVYTTMCGVGFVSSFQRNHVRCLVDRLVKEQIKSNECNTMHVLKCAMADMS